MAATLILACSNYPWTLRYYDMNIYLWALHKMRISRISNIVWRVVSGMTLQMQAELQNKQLKRASKEYCGFSGAVRKSHRSVPSLQRGAYSYSYKFLQLSCFIQVVKYPENKNFQLLLERQGHRKSINISGTHHRELKILFRAGGFKAPDVECCSSF